MDTTSSAKDLDPRDIIVESLNLPTMPVVAQQLLSIPDWENVDFNRVADIINKDVSLSYKVLRVANSPLGEIETAKSKTQEIADQPLDTGINIRQNTERIYTGFAEFASRPVCCRAKKLCHHP